MRHDQLKRDVEILPTLQVEISSFLQRSSVMWCGHVDEILNLSWRLHGDMANCSQLSGYPSILKIKVDSPSLGNIVMSELHVEPTFSDQNQWIELAFP